MRKRQRHRNRNCKKSVNQFDPVPVHNIQIMAEDILRFLTERNELNQTKTAFSDLNKIITHSKKLGRILDHLERMNDIIILDEHVELTDEGLKKGHAILKKHQALEKTFSLQNNKINPHYVADMMEHSLNDNEINKIVSFTDKNRNLKDYSLNDLDLPVVTITRLQVQSERIFYKLLALGLYPSQRIEIQQRNGRTMIIKIKNSRFAIDQSIIQSIYAIP